MSSEGTEKRVNKTAQHDTSLVLGGFKDYYSNLLKHFWKSSLNSQINLLWILSFSITKALLQLILLIWWSERMLDTVGRRRKIYKKHCFDYTKKFLPWRYLLLFLWKLDILSFHLLYRSLYKRSKDITKWSWPGHSIFALSKTAPNSR